MCCCNTFSATYVDPDTVVPNPILVGKEITFGLAKSSCLAMYITYSTGHEGNTLTVILEVWDDAFGAWMTITGVLNLSISSSGVQIVSLPGGPRKVRFSFETVGTPGADTITVGLSGLPQGYTIS